MNSMFPSLEPRFANHVFFELDPLNEEAEIQRFEKNQEIWVSLKDSKSINCKSLSF